MNNQKKEKFRIRIVAIRRVCIVLFAFALILSKCIMLVSLVAVLSGFAMFTTHDGAL